MAEYHFPITVRIIVIGMRQMKPTLTTHLAEIGTIHIPIFIVTFIGIVSGLAWRYRERCVAGFDIAGPEAGYSSKSFKEHRCFLHMCVY